MLNSKCKQEAKPATSPQKINKQTHKRQQQIQVHKCNINSSKITSIIENIPGAIAHNHQNNIMEEDERGKLFVGGLSWETTQENLSRYFCRFGDIIDCVVMKNNESGRSRGFGFVTFADPTNVNHVLQNGPHTLDGRTIDPKPCNPRTLQKPKKGGGYKVFLGGLPSNVTETDLRTFFGRYGKVTEVVIMYDQEKKKSRGFGFLSFEEESSVEHVTNERYINLNGKQVCTLFVLTTIIYKILKML